MIRFLQILVQGRPNRKADFNLPSAEGRWGYPEDMLVVAPKGQPVASGTSGRSKPSS